MVGLVISLLMVVNIGQLYYAQRDLQRQAVMAALAGAGVASGCLNGGVPGNTTPTVTSAVTNALNNNGGSGSLLTGINGSSAVQLGWANDTAGQALVEGGATIFTAPSDGLRYFQTLSDNDSHINAVRVNLSEPQPTPFGTGFSLFGATFSGKNAGSLYASATAAQQPLGAFSIGSTLASLNTSSSTLLNPLLSGLLGSSVNLTAIGYQGLAQTQVSLANLEVAAGVNNLQSLLSLSTNAAGLKTIFAAAVNQANPSVANTITGLTLGTTQSTQSVSLSNILGNIATGLNPTVTDAAGAVPFVNALDLLMALGQAAAGTSANQYYQINIPAAVSINGVTSVAAFVNLEQLMQPSTLGPVGTTQSTAQINLHLRLQVSPTAVTSLLSSLLGALANLNAYINLGIDIKVAAATGTLSAITCPRVAGASSPTATVNVSTGVSRIKIGSFTGSPSLNPDLDSNGGTLLSVTAKVGLLATSVSVTGTTTGHPPISDDPPGIGLGSGSSTFTVFSPAQKISGNEYSAYYSACNNNTASADPTDCGGTTDPNNPASPVPSVNVTSGLTTLVSNLLADTSISINASVLGIIPVSLTTNAVTSALNSALIAPLSAGTTGLEDALIDPLLQYLGVQLGSGTILMQAVEVGQPVLTSTALPGTAKAGS